MSTEVGAPGGRGERPTEFSAGGVVVRAGKVAVIVPVKRDSRGHRVLCLPKGHPEAGESAEQAALREVREEAGLTTELLDDLGEVHYTYERHGHTVDKTVRFFLLRYVSGDPAEHDHEVEQASWMPLAEAAEALSFSGEREMVARAISKLAAER